MLLVEDDDILSTMLTGCLELAGFNVFPCSTIEEMIRLLSSRRVDVIVLDICLPDGNSLHALAGQRAPSAPVICITANPAVDARIEALGGMAADILVKPFDERELILRIRNALKSKEKSVQVLCFGGFTFDLATGYLTAADGTLIALTTMEHRLLYSFAHNPNRPLTRQWLLHTVFDRNHVADDRIVDVTVGRLRKKLGPQGHSLVRSVRCIGYQFAVDEETEPKPVSIPRSLGR